MLFKKRKDENNNKLSYALVKKDDNIRVTTHITLIKTFPGYEAHVWNSLARIVCVSELHPIFGEWDIIVYWIAELNLNQYDIAEFIANEIYTIEGVIKIKTLTLPNIFKKI